MKGITKGWWNNATSCKRRRWTSSWLPRTERLQWRGQKELQSDKEKMREDITGLQGEVQELTKTNAAQHTELCEKEQEIQKGKRKKQA